MKRLDLDAPWPHSRAAMRDISAEMGGEDSRLTAQMRRVHQSRCARALSLEMLGELGVEASVIGKGPVGQPIWPAGMVGSLSHTENCVVAIVASAKHCKSVGIDVEPALPLLGATHEIVLLESERDWIKGVGTTMPAAGRMVFSAKECVHKAIHPLTGVWLDFSEVAIEFDARLERFEPVPVTAAARAAFLGLRADGRAFFVSEHIVLMLHLH